MSAAPATAAAGGVAGNGAEVRYEESGAVARLTIDRPERRNALSPAVLGALRAGIAAAKADRSVRVLVLAGAGDRAFCAGADLAGPSMMAAPGGDAPPDARPVQAGIGEQHEARADLARLFLDLWELGKPTIARVQGYAMAGGFGLALACDVVVAAEEAVFCASEVNVGLWPFMISVPLARSMPPKVALELMMTGRRVGAEEGARIGFVNRVVRAASLDVAVEEIAAELASAPPLAMKLGRDAFYATLGMEPHQALATLRTTLGLVTMSHDAAEGITAFLEKRPPNWSGT